MGFPDLALLLSAALFLVQIGDECPQLHTKSSRTNRMPILSLPIVEPRFSERCRHGHAEPQALPASCQARPRTDRAAPSPSPAHPAGRETMSQDTHASTRLTAFMCLGVTHTHGRFRLHSLYHKSLASCKPPQFSRIEYV